MVWLVCLSVSCSTLPSLVNNIRYTWTSPLEAETNFQPRVGTFFWLWTVVSHTEVLIGGVNNKMLFDVLYSYLPCVDLTVLCLFNKKQQQLHPLTQIEAVGETRENVLVFFKLRPTVITEDNLHHSLLVSSMLESPINTLYQAVRQVFAPVLLKVSLSLCIERFQICYMKNHYL